MEDVNGTVDAVLFKEVLKDGTKLIVMARKVEKEKWQLLVQNEYGISSNWLELYPSAQLAIDAGVKSVEEEGIERFIDTEGYEYLFE
jgi:hypothetical protein